MCFCFCFYCVVYFFRNLNHCKSKHFLFYLRKLTSNTKVRVFTLSKIVYIEYFWKVQYCVYIKYLWKYQTSCEFFKMFEFFTQLKFKLNLYSPSFQPNLSLKWHICNIKIFKFVKVKDKILKLKFYYSLKGFFQV